MNDKRFRVRFEQEDGRGEIVNEKGVELTAREVVDLLNKQQDTIITLKRRLEKINGGYGHLTHRNGLTANEWVIESQEKELKKKNEQISDWIEQHSKDIAKISEQQATIRELNEEMVRLHKMSIELMDRVIPNLRRENKQLLDDKLQLEKLLQEAEEEINKLKKSNQLLMETHINQQSD